MRACKRHGRKPVFLALCACLGEGTLPDDEKVSLRHVRESDLPKQAYSRPIQTKMSRQSWDTQDWKSCPTPQIDWQSVSLCEDGCHGGCSRNLQSRCAVIRHVRTRTLHCHPVDWLDFESSLNLRRQEEQENEFRP